MVKDINVIREIGNFANLISTRISENLKLSLDGNNLMYDWYPLGIDDEFIERFRIKTDDVFKLIEFAIEYYEYFFHRNEIELMESTEHKNIILVIVTSKIVEISDNYIKSKEN